jgi:hypothetical protein
MITWIHEIKEQHAQWRDPASLARVLGFQVVVGSLGEGREGASLDDLIVISPDSGTSERLTFTYYHEIVHKLIRRHDALLSELHEQFTRSRDLDRVLEHLSNVGAAEFLIPRSQVIRECGVWGYTVAAITRLREVSGASATAICVQIGLSAPHRCIALVARRREVVGRGQSQLIAGGEILLVVELGVSSRSMRYTVARDTPIEAGHLLHSVFRCQEREVVSGTARIPFRQETNWSADCEAIQLGSQVFALFHADPAPQRVDEHQMHLRF